MWTTVGPYQVCNKKAIAPSCLVPASSMQTVGVTFSKSALPNNAQNKVQSVKDCSNMMTMTGVVVIWQRQRWQ